MTDPVRLAAFALTCLIVAVIPGPSVLFVVGRALALGRRAALATALGNSIGGYALAVMVALGVSAVIERSVLVFTVVKLAGAAYLVYLGVKAFRERGSLAAVSERLAPTGGAWRRMGEAALVGVTNPKTMVIYAAVLPQFVDRSAGNVTGQLLLLALCFVVLALATDSVWALVAGTARGWFARSPRRLRLIGGAGGLTMIGLGVGMAVTGRKD